MHLILTGATGTVGQPALKACLSASNITKVSILARKEFPLPQGDGVDTSKATILVHKDFLTYPEELTNKLKDADGCIWMQGVSQTAVGKEEYIRITHDFPLAAAKAFGNSGRKFNFVYVSGDGADPTEKTPILFGKIKGRTEKDLLAFHAAHSSFNVFNVRPGYVDPPRTDKPRPLLQRTLVDNGLVHVFRRWFPNQISPVAELSKIMIDLATGDGEPIKPLNASEDLKGKVEADGRTVTSTGIRWWYTRS